MRNVFATSGSVNWFNVVGYDPIHVFGDTSVIYEYCNGYTYFDQLTSLASEDWGFLAERLTRDATYMITDFGSMMAKKKQFAGRDPNEDKEPEPEADTTTDASTETSGGDEWESWSTQFQWDFSDITDEDVKQYIPQDMMETGKVWGEIIQNMLGTTISPNT